MQKRDLQVTTEIAALKGIMAEMGKQLANLTDKVDQLPTKLLPRNNPTAPATRVAYATAARNADNVTNKHVTMREQRSSNLVTIHGCANVKGGDNQAPSLSVADAPNVRPRNCRSVYVGNLRDETADRIKQYVQQRNSDLYNEHLQHIQVYPLVKKTADADNTPINLVKASSFRVVIAAEQFPGILNGAFWQKGTVVREWQFKPAPLGPRASASQASVCTRQSNQEGTQNNNDDDQWNTTTNRKRKRDGTPTGPGQSDDVL